VLLQYFFDRNHAIGFGVDAFGLRVAPAFRVCRSIHSTRSSYILEEAPTCHCPGISKVDFLR